MPIPKESNVKITFFTVKDNFFPQKRKCFLLPPLTNLKNYKGDTLGNSIRKKKTNLMSVRGIRTWQQVSGSKTWKRMKKAPFRGPRKGWRSEMAKIHRTGLRRHGYEEEDEKDIDQISKRLGRGGRRSRRRRKKRPLKVGEQCRCRNGIFDYSEFILN